MEFPVSKICSFSSSSEKIRHIVDLAILIDFWPIIGAILELFLEQFFGKFLRRYLSRAILGAIVKGNFGRWFWGQFLRQFLA